MAQHRIPLKRTASFWAVWNTGSWAAVRQSLGYPGSRPHGVPRGAVHAYEPTGRPGFCQAGFLQMTIELDLNQ